MPTTDREYLNSIASTIAAQSDELASLIRVRTEEGVYIGQWEHLRDELARANAVAVSVTTAREGKEE